MAGTLKGELSTGDARGLASGFVVTWNQSATWTLYTSSPNITGFVVLHVLARSTSGAQPVSFTVSVNGNAITSAINLSGITATVGYMATFGSSFTQAVIGGPNQTIAVAPLSNTAGTCTFDVLGYEF